MDDDKSGDKSLDEKMAGLLAPTVAAEPPPPPPPDATVGPIVEEASAPSAAWPAFHEPTADELAQFPEPPPITAATPAVPSPPPEAPATRAAPVFPLAGTVMGDRSSHSGLSVGHAVPTPQIIIDAPPSPPKEVAFDDLPERTKAEIRGGWLAIHGTMEGFTFGGTNTPPAAAPFQPTIDEPVPATEPEIDLSKLSAKTRAELEGGRQRLAQRNSDYQAVLRRVAERDAKKLNAGDAPLPSNMDYSTRG